MFHLELKLKSNNKDIYKIGSLLECRVKFEPSYLKREIPQFGINCSMATQKVFAFVKRDTLNAQETIQPLTVHAERNPRISNAKTIIQPITKVICSTKNYKRVFSLYYGEKMVRSESQPQTEPANIQTRLIQPDRSYALVTRTENRQPITSQNNQETQEK